MNPSELSGPLVTDDFCTKTTGHFEYYSEICSGPTTYNLTEFACVSGQMLINRGITLAERVDDAITEVECTPPNLCHNCGLKLVCSSSSDTQAVCSALTAEPPTCASASSGLANSYLCFNDVEFETTLEFCTQGEYSTTELERSCEDFPLGFPYCLSCGGVGYICAKEATTCEELIPESPLTPLPTSSPTSSPTSLAPSMPPSSQSLTSPPPFPPSTLPPSPQPSQPPSAAAVLSPGHLLHLDPLLLLGMVGFFVLF